MPGRDPEKPETGRAPLDGFADINTYLGVARRFTLTLDSTAGSAAPSDNTTDFMLSGANGGWLSGGGGNDMLVGRNGQDFLTGGTGDDILIGEAALAAYRFRSIDRRGCHPYPVVIPAKTRDHAGRQIPEMREASPGG